MLKSLLAMLAISAPVAQPVDSPRVVAETARPAFPLQPRAAPIVHLATTGKFPVVQTEDHNPLACGLAEMTALKWRGHSDEYAFACAMKRAFAEHYHAAPSNAGRKVFAALDELLARAIDDERGAA